MHYFFFITKGVGDLRAYCTYTVVIIKPMTDVVSASFAHDLLAASGCEQYLQGILLFCNALHAMYPQYGTFNA